MKALVLTGRVTAGADAQVVWPKVAALFKLDPAAFQQRVLARCPATVQRLEDARAETVRRHLILSGAEALVLEIGATQWQIDLSGSVRGPVPGAGLLAMLKSGQLETDTRVRSGADHPWTTLQEATGHTAKPVLAPASIVAPARAQAIKPEPLGEYEWRLQAKPTPYWKFLLGANFFKRYQLDYIEKRGDELTVAVLSGKAVTFAIGHFKASIFKTKHELRDFRLKSQLRADQKVTFRETQLQMPEEWWDEVEQRLDATEHLASQLVHGAKRLLDKTSGTGGELDAQTLISSLADSAKSAYVALFSRTSENKKTTATNCSYSDRGRTMKWTLSALALTVVLGSVAALTYYLGQSRGTETESSIAATRKAPAHTSTQTPPATSQPPAIPANTTAGTDTSTSPFQLLLDPKGRIGQGRCHMGSCSWSRWLAVRRLSAGPNVVVQATVLGGTSEHAETSDYPSSPDGVAIEWNDEPHELTIRCSYSHPSVVHGEESTELPFDSEQGVPGAYESAAEIYFQACHSDFDGYSIAERRHGYRVEHDAANTVASATTSESVGPSPSNNGLGTVAEATKICTSSPTFEFSDPDDPSPWGTKVSCEAISGFRLSLLAENSTHQPPDNDAVMYYALTALTSERRAVPMFDGAFRFNESTRDDVRKHFGRAATESHGSIGNPTAFDSALKIPIEGNYAYFRFKKGVLVNFALATFDIDTAD